jgi:hypothetical protein
MKGLLVKALARSSKWKFLSRSFCVQLSFGLTSHKRLPCGSRKEERKRLAQLETRTPTEAGIDYRQWPKQLTMRGSCHIKQHLQSILIVREEATIGSKSRAENHERKKRRCS